MRKCPKVYPKVASWWIRIFAAAVTVWAVLSAAEARPPVILPGPAGTEETHQLVWETVPGVRYEVQTTTDLSDPGAWETVVGYPVEAATVVDSLPFSTVGQAARFFRIIPIDEQAPTIAGRFPEAGSFAVSRVSPLVIELMDWSGIDPATISLAVGGLGTFGLGDPELSYVDGTLIFDRGNIPLGAYGAHVGVHLVVADTLGNAGSHAWSFRLEQEPKLAGDLLVLGSPEALAAGQQLTPEQQAVLAAVASADESGAMAAGSRWWSLSGVTPGTLVFDYDGGTPPDFQPGQFLANLAPGHVDEVFYRQVISVADQTPGSGQLTVQTADVGLLEIFEQASISSSRETGGQVVFAVDGDGSLVGEGAGFSVGGAFEETLDFLDGGIDFDLAGIWLSQPALRVAIDIEDSRVEEFFFRYDGRTTMRVAPTVTVAGPAEETVTTDLPLLSSQHLVYLGQAGAVPVWIDLGFLLDAEAGVEVSGPASFSAAVEKTERIFLEANFSAREPTRNEWKTSGPITALSTEGPSVAVDGSARIWATLLPQIDAGLDGLFGLDFELASSLELDGNGSGGSGTFDLTGRILARAGLDLSGVDEEELPVLADHELARQPWRFQQPPPGSLTILEHPASASAQLGESVVFRSLAVAGSAISYQWYFDGIPLPRQTGPSLKRSHVRLEDAGNYSVLVTSGGESLMSEVATLTVTLPPGPPAPEGRIVGLWHFDHDFSDSSGYGSTADYNTSLGTPVISHEIFQVGYGSVNSGAASEISVLRLILSEAAGALDGSTEFGLSMWVYRNQNATGNTRMFAFSVGPRDPTGLHIRRTSGTPLDQYFLANAGLNGLGGGAFTLPYQEWTHIAITADGQSAGLYINGEMVHSTVITDTGTQGVRLGNFIHLGSLHAGSGSYLNTFWDELVLYDGPTDGAWAMDWYEQGSQTAPVGMVTVSGGTLPAISGLGELDVGDFHLGRNLVTWQEWQTVRDWAVDHGYDLADIGAGCDAQHPVHSVNWYDVLKWCNARSEMEGLTPVYLLEGEGTIYRSGEFGRRGAGTVTQDAAADGYRLPTEAEWEFAARGGNQSGGHTFSGSDDLNLVGWYVENSSGAACGLSQGRGTHPVGQKAPNELGIFDMSGNLWEWCWDAANDTNRRIRGGDWSSGYFMCALTVRNFNYPDLRTQVDGFRIARRVNE